MMKTPDYDAIFEQLFTAVENCGQLTDAHAARLVKRAKQFARALNKARWQTHREQVNATQLGKALKLLGINSQTFRRLVEAQARLKKSIRSAKENE